MTAATPLPSEVSWTILNDLSKKLGIPGTMCGIVFRNTHLAINGKSCINGLEFTRGKWMVSSPGRYFEVTTLEEVQKLVDLG